MQKCQLLLQESFLNPMLRRSYRLNTKLNKHPSEFNLYACIYFSILLKHMKTNYKSEMWGSVFLDQVGQFIYQYKEQECVHKFQLL
jgi:hypothetical protein